MGLVRSVRYFENILIEYFNKTKFITTDLIKQIKLILRKYINQDSVASMQLQEVGKHPPPKKTPEDKNGNCRSKSIYFREHLNFVSSQIKAMQRQKLKPSLPF